MTRQTMIQTNNQDKLKRFDIEDLTRKGFRMYPMEATSDKDKENISKILYYRYFLDNFFVGKVVMVKNRRD